MSDYEYQLTVKKLDDIFEKKEDKHDINLTNDKLSEKKKNKLKKIKKEKKAHIKKESQTVEDDLYQEIYGKFNENYSELVEDYIQKLVKYENKKIKNAYLFGVSFCIITISLAALFSSIIPI
jgi:hypothetical protein